MHQRHEVVITGVGVVAPNGCDKTSFWAGLKEGRNAVGPISRFDASKFTSRMAGEIKDFKPHPRIPVEHLPAMDRAYQMGITAAFEALEDSRLDVDAIRRDRAGVYMGIAVTAMDGYEGHFRSWRKDPVIRPGWYYGWFPSACSGYLSQLTGFQGNSHVLSTGCCSSVDAVGMAIEEIRSGKEDVALVGGTEAPITPLVLNAFCAIRALSTRNDDPTHASRPFDMERDGFILAEGAAALMLESAEHAQARGATVYAKLRGFSTTSNAYHMTAPDPSSEQSARGFLLGLQDAGLEPEQVDVVLTHGSSTPLNERAETRALGKAFGAHARRLAIPSIKSMIGHSLGSAGLLQLAAAVMILVEKVIPPTINYETPDPDCDLDCVPNHARPTDAKIVMTNTAGFSGKNTVLVVGAA